LVYIPQSYNHVHMVTGGKDHRFYKRFEYSSMPMDYFEVKNRFEELGHTEEFRKNYIIDTIKQLSRHVVSGHTKAATNGHIKSGHFQGDKNVNF